MDSSGSAENTLPRVLYTEYQLANRTLLLHSAQPICRESGVEWHRLQSVGFRPRSRAIQAPKIPWKSTDWSLGCQIHKRVKRPAVKRLICFWMHLHQSV